MFGRLLAIKVFVSILLLTGCATTQHTAPRFTEPSTIPIKKAIAVAQAHIQSARQEVTIISNECPEAKAQIDALSTDLDGAYNELQTSEGARAQLQTTLEQEVAQANQLATDYDKSGAQITLLKESRHSWVKRFWLVTGLLTVAGIWIFRKPLLLLVGL